MRTPFPFLSVLVLLLLPIRVFADAYSDLIQTQESGGNYSIVSSSGTAAGAYQITAGTWESLGYTSGSGGSWSGYTFTAAAQAAGVSSLNDLLYTPAGHALQDQAFNQLTQANWNSMSSQTQALVGTTVNGVQITQSGLLTAAHFLGAGGLNNWVASGFDPHVFPQSYLTANGFSSYEELQAHLLNRIAAANGATYSGGASGGTWTEGGMYEATENFPGFGAKRAVVIQETPPFQGQRDRLR